VNERELSRARDRREREVDRRFTVAHRPPKGPDRAVAVWDGHEHHTIRLARQAIQAGRVGCDHRVLVRHDDVRQAALAAIADAVSVGIDERDAGDITLLRQRDGRSNQQRQDQ